VKSAEVSKLAMAGYLVPGQPRAGGTGLYWPEFEVARLQREGGAGEGVAPYR
jgi:hypothetical protein